MKKCSKILSVLLLVTFFSFAQTIAPQHPQKPNIVLIISDDHAYQAISAYGGTLMQTSNIDRIAKAGVLFKKAYVTNSICGPSRAVILTGKYSHKNGFKDNLNPNFDGSQNTFIKELTNVGYQTAWIGKWHLGSKPQGFSFWQILPDQGSYYNPDFIMQDGSIKNTEGYVTTAVEDAAEEWLAKRDNTKPFCLVIGHKATHRTWMPDIPDMGMFDNVNFPLPENFYDSYTNRNAASQQDMTIAKTMIMGYDLKMFETKAEEDKQGSIKRMNVTQRAKFDAYYNPIYKDLKSRSLSGNALAEWKFQRYMRDYLSTAASLDRNIGRTLDYLDKQNLTNNTIVIYVSDQGFYMGEHGWFDKRWIYEESFRTPMIMSWPGVINSGIKNNNLVMNLDIAPTLLTAAGVAVPSDIQGKSFLSLVANKKVKADFADKKIKGRKAMYYHYYEFGEHSVSPHFGISTGKYKLIRFYKQVNGWELYDLQHDPSEMKNVYGNKKYKKIKERLKKQLNGLIEKYEDEDAKKILNNE